jgi:SIT family siderophore-iron:H+ symporter-like MFS transporter
MFLLGVVLFKLTQPSLDGTVRYTYQVTALSQLQASAQISTVTVVRSVAAAAAQPAFAKISDYFGRVSILFLAVVFYIVGACGVCGFKIV